MVSQTDIDMLPNINVRTSMVDDGMAGENGNIDSSLLNELELLLQEQQNNSYDISEREWDLNIFRSGSAPPTIQGSINATNSLCGTLDFGSISNGNGGLNGTVMSEDEIRSHPAYLSYYYSHDNLNPRLPHPLLSKEEWRMHQRFGNDGGSQFESMWDCRKKGLMDGGESSSLFSVQPALPGQKKVNGNVESSVLNSGNLAMQASADWRDVETDGLVGLVGSGIGPRRKSFADILQEGLDRSASLSGSVSRPASRNSFGDSVHTAFISDSHAAEFCDVPQSREGSHPGAASLVRVQSHGSMVSRPSPSVVGASISRSDTPEIQVAGRSKTPGLPPVGRITPGNINDKTEPRAISHHSSTMAELSEVVACLSGLSLSEEGLANGFSHEHSQLYPAISIQPNSLSNEPNGVQHHHPDMSTVGKLAVPSVCSDLFGKEGMTLDHRVSQLDVSGQVSFPKRTASYANLYSERNWQGTEGLEGSPFLQQKTKFPAAPGPEKHLVNRKLNSAISNHLDRGCPRNNRSGNRIQLEGHLPAVNSEIVQYLQRAAGYSNLNSFQGNSFGQNFVGASQGLMTSEKAHLEALLAQQQEQFDLRAPVKSHGFNPGYNENPSYELGMQYQGVSMGNSSRAVKFGNSMLQNDRLARFNPMIRSPMGGPNGSWHLDIGMGVESRCVSTLLEEFKNNKTRSFELSDLVGHVVEFSMDQSGSRFIQQKLEAATDEDKMRIFPEIIPHVRTLMTDVFGNYVIQKFFEHGTQSQREELASQLAGHVLPLSLQMYGCRVIQKALEVVDMDRKTKMVAELDGSVIKCVRDQNGNHVIQKCIECVPESKIRFIISAFFGQVVALSTHPYGCRVIQRVLEHCHDPDTQKIIMDEIMQSVCILAQDQYGNYVIQHVIQHGKPQERSAIIRKLAGQIVKMSQQKFASNVVEKSLTYGGPEERQLLVNEILGTTDENEPLQVMMKDQFGNYVVQKVLETCDEQSRELVLSRIKVHVSALKRYTYGKHIVSRVEKLLTAGERRAVTS